MATKERRSLASNLPFSGENGNWPHCLFQIKKGLTILNTLPKHKMTMADLKEREGQKKKDEKKERERSMNTLDAHSLSTGRSCMPGLRSAEGGKGEIPWGQLLELKVLKPL